MGFLDTVRQADALLHRDGRVSKHALQREFDLDDAQVDAVVRELVDVRRVATVEGDVVVASSASATASADTDRRDLTVLFCDLVGSTELSTQIDSEDYGETIRVYHDAVTTVVTRFGGFVAQLLGDGLLVLFGYPEAQEDSAEQGVRAALDIVRVVHELGRDLSVRVGLHSGPCVIRTVGAGGRRDTVVLGETPNIAARIQALAEPGRVMMSAATYALVGGWFVVEEAGMPEMKGVMQPIAVHRVLRPSAARSRLEARSAGGLRPMIGRDREHQLLIAAWDAACRGSGQSVHICGEPGIGKSRLALVLREHLARQPHFSLDGSCTHYVRNTAFHPIVQIIEQVLGFTPDDRPADRVLLVERGLHAVGLDSEELVGLVTSFLALPPSSSGVLDGLSGEARRRRTIDGLVEWLIALSAHDPVVVVIEDLHWCDPSSLELVAKVVERIATERILVVTTARPEFVPTWNTHDYFHIVNLDRVNQTEATELVNAMLADSTVDDLVRRTIVERADGNPLFIEELSQMVREANHDATAIPSTLQSSLLARLDRLGQAKVFAQAAAVIGRDFSREMLQLVVADAYGACDIDELDDALGNLTGSGLVALRTPQPETYMFKHALVQDAANHSLLRATRSQLHKSVVHVLRDRFPARVSAQPELAARHAEAGGLVHEAIDWYEQASTQAHARSEHDEALLHMHRALALLATETESIERDRREIALQQMLIVELFQSRGYTVPESLAALERVRTLARACGDLPGEAGAAIGFALAAYTATDFASARTFVLDGLAIAERVGSVPHIVAALGTDAIIGFFQGRFSEGLDAAERAVALYRPEPRHHEQVAIVGDDSGVSSLSTSGWILFHLGYPDQALARCDEAVQLARSFDSQYTVAQAISWRLALFNESRDMDFEHQASIVLQYCNEQGFPLMGATAALFLGRARGDLDMILAAAAQLASTGMLVMAPAACSWLAEAYAGHGLFDEAFGSIDVGLETAVATDQHFYDSHLHRMRGGILLIDTRDDEIAHRKAAEDEFRLAIEIADAQQSKAFALQGALNLARLLIEEARPREARACLEPLLASFTEGFGTRDLRDARELLRNCS